MGRFPGAGQDLSAAISVDLQELGAEGGIPIAAGIRRPMERALDADFSGVHIHTGPFAARLCEKLEALAFAQGEHIAFARGAYQPDTPFGRRVLAHELAHVVQQRRGRATATTIGSRPALEAEADAAADAVLCGARFDCGLTDASDQPACWDIAGHYYTSYLALLNGQVDREVAQRIALWCWLPDQVEEFDAAYVGEHTFLYSSGYHHAKDVYEKAEPTYLLSESNYVAAVQKGLHVLTGGNSSDMTETCVHRFADPGADTKLLFRGISLHAFGDCFAHRDLGNDGLLYGQHAPLGHAMAGHTPDNIWDPRRCKNYVAYVRGLSDMIEKYTGRKPLVGQDELVTALSAMLDLDHKDVGERLGVPWAQMSVKARNLANRGEVRDEKGCCDHIRRVGTELCGVNISSRHPNGDSVPWKEYYPGLKNWLVMDSGGRDDEEGLFRDILLKAIQWSGVLVQRRPPRYVAPNMNTRPQW